MKESVLEEKLYILHSLSSILYSSTDCICGGPLHIVLDDGNMRDSDLEFCLKQSQKDEWCHVKEISECILKILYVLSPAQRWYWWQHMSISDILSVAGKNIILTENGYKIEGH